MNCENFVASLSQLDVSKLLSTLTTSSSEQEVSSSSLSPSSSSTTSSSSSSIASALSPRRKRRRGEISNPSNTLDALVARKADDQPFEKRYLSEQEAIEGPDDELELKKIEMDPDVSTRTCSTCGYQGKWVSEMIRHKRVHTSERPFKCRYCSRTSKWKADLIRHVAKTHGIRVVSKYSRSKVFDPIVPNCEDHQQQHQQQHQTSANNNSITTNAIKASSVTYRCTMCTFEDERVSILTAHVKLSHGTAPCVCRRCGAAFDELHEALAHTSNVCLNAEMVFNVMPSYEKTSPLLSPCQSESSTDSGIHTEIEEDVAKSSSILAIQPTPILLSPSTQQAPAMPDLQAALLNLQTSLYLASLLSTTLLTNSSTVIQPSTVIQQPNITQNNDHVDVVM